MPIISDVEAKGLRGRLMHAGIIIALLVGCVTVLYPFMIMVSGSIRSEMDQSELDMVPDFLFDEQVLARKFLETKYDQDVSLLDRAHLGQTYSFQLASVPERVAPQRVADMQAFFEEANIPLHWQMLGGIEGVKTVPEHLRELRKRLVDRFDGDLEAFSREMGAPVETWGVIVLSPPEWLSRRGEVDPNPVFEIYTQMLTEAPLAQRRLVSLSGYFLETIIKPVYGQNVAAYNAAHAQDLPSYAAFRLPRSIPGEDQPKLRAEWLEFVREEVNVSFVTLEGVPESAYQAFLREQYVQIDELNEVWSTSYASFEDIRLPSGTEWLSGAVRIDYRAFMDEGAVPAEALRLTGPEFAWHDWLQQKYDSLAALNTAHEASYTDFADAWMPMDHVEYEYAVANAGSLRWAYATRNFINVFDELFIQGRAFMNTAIFCALSILAALLINPMAAYAMSRFRLPGTYKILLLLMATISFPPMVTMIPQFIMLRQMNLLNTFVALLLPGLANGYLIFLLKGFFDSLPQELYEAARIDGASEVRMFFQITLALSKPILAVVALSAFNSAYMMFLYALIVAPDENMWLLSVWLYQYQERASSSGMFASVLIASIPTLLVFIFAQRTIMRGIVVPTEK